MIPEKKEEPGRTPKTKLNLYSMAHCEAMLGFSRGELQKIADNAGAYYQPFLKPQRVKPFQRVVKLYKRRTIDNPTGDLKAVQKRINERMLKSIAFPEYLCGGIPGKTILDNVAMHHGAKTLVTVDIKNFFPKINNLRIYQVWRDLLNCSPEIAGLLTRLTTFERHLPQGAPTSSLLANLVLSSVDREIRERCLRLSVTYSTWVDDLAFSGEEAREVINAAVLCLRRAGFSIPHKKMHIMGPRKRHVLNGVVMGRFPNVLPQRVSALRSGIHKIKTDVIAPDEMDRYVRQLRGGIAFVAYINPRKGSRLNAELGRALAPRDAKR